MFLLMCSRKKPLFQYFPEFLFLREPLCFPVKMLLRKRLMKFTEKL